MKQNRHISFLVVMISLLAMLVSCGPSAEEKKAKEAAVMDSVPSATDEVNEEATAPSTELLEQTFVADTLTAEQLMVFQQRGAEKLADFINYIEIISNKTYDVKLRQEIRKQVEALFWNSATAVAISIQDKKEMKPISSFLDEVYKSGYDSIEVKTDSVVLKQPVKTANTGYTGSVSANVTIRAYKNGKVIFSSAGLKEAVTNIMKTEKNFGTDKKLVWEVVLGEMK